MARKANTQASDTGRTPEEERAEADRAEEGHEAGEAHETEEVGAPATEEEAPSIEELVPGIGDALGEEGADRVDARIAELEAEVKEKKDQLLRALAELENTRRRAERDRRDAETYGGTRLARDLLVVYDNLNRALDAADEELREKHGAFLEGVELTQRELLGAFARHRIEKVSPEKGERFDPHLHQAMFEAPVPGAADGTIIEVMEDGFTIAERLLRPARVGVAKGGQQQAAGAETATGEDQDGGTAED